MVLINKYYLSLLVFMSLIFLFGGSSLVFAQSNQNTFTAEIIEARLFLNNGKQIPFESGNIASQNLLNGNKVIIQGTVRVKDGELLWLNLETKTMSVPLLQKALARTPMTNGDFPFQGEIILTPGQPVEVSLSMIAVDYARQGPGSSISYPASPVILGIGSGSTTVGADFSANFLETNIFLPNGQRVALANRNLKAEDLHNGQSLVLRGKIQVVKGNLGLFIIEVDGQGFPLMQSAGGGQPIGPGVYEWQHVIPFSIGQTHKVSLFAQGPFMQQPYPIKVDYTQVPITLSYSGPALPFKMTFQNQSLLGINGQNYEFSKIPSEGLTTNVDGPIQFGLRTNVVQQGPDQKVNTVGYSLDGGKTWANLNAALTAVVTAQPGQTFDIVYKVEGWGRGQEGPFTTIVDTLHAKLIVKKKSLPKVKVPSVQNKTRTEAGSILNKNNLKAVFIEQPTDQPSLIGKAFKTDPVFMTEVLQGSEVKVTIGKQKIYIVPDVLRSGQESARSLLFKAGFQTSTSFSTTLNTAMDGLVVATSPQAGMQAPKGMIVRITVAKAKVSIVPDVIGKTSDEATAAISTSGFKVEENTEEVLDKTKDRKVVKTMPAEGVKRVGEAGTVKIYMGRMKRVPLPDVVGKKESEAKAILAPLGFQVRVMIRNSEDRALSGKVIRTSPSAGSLHLEYGASVMLDVAQVKRIQVPNVVGKTLGEAKKALEAVKLNVASSVRIQEVDGAHMDGKVISTVPAANSTWVEITSTVHLTVGKAKVVIVPEISLTDIKLDGEPLPEIPPIIPIEEVEGGQVHITGMVKSNVLLDSLQLSFDGGTRFEKVEAKPNWEYTFKPEVDKNYEVVVKARLKDGKDVEIKGYPKKRFRFVKTEGDTVATNEDAEKVLTEMVRAYEAKDASGFLSRVSEDFPNRGELEEYARRDFKDYSSIKINLRITSTTNMSNGKSVQADWDMKFFPTTVSKQISITGANLTFVFANEEGKLKLKDMRGVNPLFAARSPDVAAGSGVPANVVAVLKKVEDEGNSSSKQTVLALIGLKIESGDQVVPVTFEITEAFAAYTNLGQEDVDTDAVQTNRPIKAQARIRITDNPKNIDFTGIKLQVSDSILGESLTVTGNVEAGQNVLFQLSEDFVFLLANAGRSGVLTFTLDPDNKFVTIDREKKTVRLSYTLL